MPAPTLTPTLKPFRQALAFHRQRVPMTRDQFRQLSREAQLRAFTVSGLARQSSIAEAYRLAELALENGMTVEQFRDQLRTFIEANEGAVLSDARLDLIFRQAIGTARSIGRYEQMTDPDVLEARPYWMYSLGPDDDRTTEVCRNLQGFIAAADAPVWQHIYPPNHFNERHSVVSLSAAQANAAGGIYPLPDDEYPFVNDRRILPDPGFDYPPSLVASDGQQLVSEIAALGEAIEAKNAAAYGLPELSSLPDGAIPEAPELLDAIPPNANDGAIESAWNDFRDVMGFAADDDQTIVIDADGDGVFVNRATFDRLIGDDTQDPGAKITSGSNARFFSTLKPTIEDPLEVWWSPRNAKDSGSTLFTKTYIAIYRDSDTNQRYAVFVTRSPQGFLMWAGFPSDPAALDALRNGYLGGKSYGRSTQ